MGWSYTTHQTRGALINELLSERHHKTVAHRLIGSRLWAVKEYQRDGARRLYVALFLIGQDGPVGYRYGYKDMDESMGPCYYDCPQSFVEMVAPYDPMGCAAQWRAAILQGSGREARS